jgi:hypothetical protein
VDAIPVWWPCISAAHQRTCRAVSNIPANWESRESDIVALLLQVRCRYRVAFEFEQSDLDLLHMQVRRKKRSTKLSWMAMRFIIASNKDLGHHRLFPFCLSAPKSDSLPPVPYQMSISQPMGASGIIEKPTTFAA